MREINVETREHLVTYTNRVPPTHSRTSPANEFVIIVFCYEGAGLMAVTLYLMTVPDMALIPN